jgi:hypothetical protein
VLVYIFINIYIYIYRERESEREREKEKEGLLLLVLFALVVELLQRLLHCLKKNEEQKLKKMGAKSQHCVNQSTVNYSIRKASVKRPTAE